MEITEPYAVIYNSVVYYLTNVMKKSKLII